MTWNLAHWPDIVKSLIRLEDEIRDHADVRHDLGMRTWANTLAAIIREVGADTMSDQLDGTSPDENGCIDWTPHRTQYDKLVAALQIAAPAYCSLRCPSVFTAVDQPRHTVDCEAMRAILDEVASR